MSIDLEIVFDVEQDSTEGLELISDGSRDIAVCISGFGSARTSVERWQSVAELTGRTTFVMRYDAQEFPWAEGEVPRTLGELSGVGRELMERWTAARLAAMGISSYLAEWIRRWTAAGRKVLLVGFSLGGFLAWKAAQAATDPDVDVILISAAIGDTPDTWLGVDKIGRLVNVFSRKDLVLKHIYPRGVASDETPAAGCGPLVAKHANVENVDVTDMVRYDHLWASRHLSALVRIALAQLLRCERHPAWCALPGLTETSLSEETYSRLLTWTFIDPELWAIVAQAVDGDVQAVRACYMMDRWAESGDRGETLEVMAMSSFALVGAVWGRDVATRSYRELSGLLKLWMSAGLDTEEGGSIEMGSTVGVAG